jgi:hypothetical protein
MIVEQRLPLESLWPVHPEPQNGESMESWIVRQAHANCSTPNEFVASYLKVYPSHSRVVVAFDLDFLHKKEESFRIVASQIGLSRAQGMTFHRFERTIGIWSETQHAMGRWRGPTTYGFHWIVPRREGRMFCPLCLTGKQNKYLHLAWRLRFIPVCVTHRVLLASECGHCHGRLIPFERNPYYDICKCARCGSMLSDTLTIAVDPNEPGYVAASTLLGLLNSTISPSDIDWKENAADLFESLRVIILLLLAESPVCQRGLHNPSVVYRLLGGAWMLLRNFDRLEQFILSKRDTEHHRVFDYVVRYRYPHKCPKSLRKYSM